jgi:NADH:ubiquinone oxidoreductase subunit 3 (subunit A)
MGLPDLLLSLPIVFLLFLAFYAILYWLGGRVAPKANSIGEKLDTYSCGEEMPVPPVKISFRLFFYIALFFTMMHVAVLVVATIPSGPLAWLGIAYLTMIFLSVMALITRN